MNIQKIVRSVLVALSMLAASVASHAGYVNVGIAIGIPPPPLPVYVQPPCPAPGYIWTPGYWAFADDVQDYYWVPGTWVYAPAPGLLWTPGYWAEDSYGYAWHAGYWAPHVGFYGGINYGFGYFGVGFAGGYWNGNDFFYNRAAANVQNIAVTNVYNNTTVVNNFYGQQASYNGPDGVHARPTGSELVALREPHRGWTGPQRLHAQDARTVPDLLASANHGRPPIAATARPDVFAGSGIVAARPIHLARGDSARGLADSGRRASASYPASDAERYSRAPAQSHGSQGLTTVRTADARLDRPSWASPGRTGPATSASRPAPPTTHSTSSAVWPVSRGTGVYPPAARTGADTRGQGWSVRPGYPAAATQAPATQWARPQPPRSNEGTWRPTRLPPARTSAAPAAAPHWAGSSSTPRYAAPSPRVEAVRAPPPVRSAAPESPRNGRRT